MRAFEQLRDVPESSTISGVERAEARELFAAFVACGGFAVWAASSERIRRAIVVGWVASYSSVGSFPELENQLYHLLRTQCPADVDPLGAALAQDRGAPYG